MLQGILNTNMKGNITITNFMIKICVPKSKNFILKNKKVF